MPRAITFIDGQNLFYQAKRCFGYPFPNYDPIKLSEAIVQLEPNRILTNVRLYTGVHKKTENRFWADFWENKLKAYSTDTRFSSFTRELEYHLVTITEIAQQGQKVVRQLKVPTEKGIDVRIALDLVTLAIQKEYDIAILFSLDRDLTEAIVDVKRLCPNILIENAFPYDPSLGKFQRRGLLGTKWIRIDKNLYDACIDPNDYSKPQGIPLFNP